MPDGFEALAPEEHLYKAAVFWRHAGDEWEAAAANLTDARLSAWALGFAYNPNSDDFARAYNECLEEIRDRFAKGAEALFDSAGLLERSADDYVDIDADLRQRVDGLLEAIEGIDRAAVRARPPAPAPARHHQVSPHLSYH